ncbi:MAG TPA: lipoate--protein ligase family protein [Candidatus Atribacteria bacterium]|nr:lipoate--protein ligase family protein [Candidatus Atribacteria bacterium]
MNFEIEKKILEICKTDSFILRFWQNNPCVIIGKFQKEEYEVDLKYINKNNIPLFRRFTGGGTVYHDRGNLNITFCKKKENILFSKYILEEAKGVTEIILEGLKYFHKNLEIKDRNSIFLDGRKILGSAVAIKNNNFFYHASLLVNSNLNELKKVIKWEENYPKKIRLPVKSKRSKVTNLSSCSPLAIDMVKEKILNKFLQSLKIKKRNVIKFYKNEFYKDKK